jgi:tetratricopeptide (TPR) repeat protein
MKKLLAVAFLLCLPQSLCAAEDYLPQGAGYLGAGNYEKAIRCYELAIRAKTDEAEAYKGLGQAYYQLGNNEIAYDVEKISAAVTAFNQSLSLKPDPEVCYLLGLSYLALYEKEDAQTAYRMLKATGSELAEKLAAKIAAYVKPAKFDYTQSAAVVNNQTPVVIAGNQVLVPVTFSYRGRSTRATLLLDTGASITSISGDMAAQLGVEPADTNPTLALVADGRTVRAHWFAADSLAVGPKAISPLRVGIMPGNLPGVDGLLGMDFLKNVRYQVNFNRNVIEWR